MSAPVGDYADYTEGRLDVPQTAEKAPLTPEQRSTITRHRPTWQKRCNECQMTVPAVGCPTWAGLSSLLDESRTPPVECRACRVLACEAEGNTAEPHTCDFSTGAES